MKLVSPVLLFLLSPVIPSATAETWHADPESRKIVPGDGSPPTGSVIIETGGKSDFTFRHSEGTAYILDRNRNGHPDFAGDRWIFDGGNDGEVDAIVDFTDRDADGKAEQFDFHLAGGFKMHGEERAPPANVAEPLPPLDVSLDAALEPGYQPENEPDNRWFDKNDDGTWTSGNVLFGGSVSCDWVVHSYERT